MLGRTNLTKVEKGAIISDIADYSWDNVKVEGINESFVKAICVNNVLIAITKRGIVAYTKDGENWETKAIELDNGDCFELIDIAYGGGKFVIVGSHTDKETYMHGLLLTTVDLINYEVKTNAENEDYFNANTINAKFLGVSAVDNNFTIFYFASSEQSSTSKVLLGLYAATIDFEGMSRVSCINALSSQESNGFSSFNSRLSDSIFKMSQKLDGGVILYYRMDFDGYCNNGVYISKDGASFKRLTDVDMEGNTTDNRNFDVDLFSVFECKDSLYFSANTADFNYDLIKVVGDSDKVTMSTNIPYGFVDAEYFNKCEVLVNSHEMLIVYPKESIADKSLDDLADITYDFSIKSIVKAFNKLYLFGTGGNILVSNSEADNGEALAIKAMSALKALYEAKAYTDKKCTKVDSLKVPRVYNSDVDYKPGKDIFEVKEFSNNSSNMPTANWYHIITMQGNDAEEKYIAQLAVGETIDALYYRNLNKNVYSKWYKVLFDGDISHFQPGEVLNLTPNLPFTAYVTGGKSQILCTIPLPKIVEGRNVKLEGKLTVRGMQEYVVRQNDISNFNVGIILTYCFIKLDIKNKDGSAFSGDNNCPLAVSFEDGLKITFS